MYALEFQGSAFTPDGKQPIPDMKAHNQEMEKLEIEWLKTGPDNVFLYVHLPKYVTPFMACGPNTATELERPNIHTLLGTVVSTYCYIGPRRQIGFGRHTYRRGVTARIFGVLYHGWYMESSGDYCRLRKARRQ
jgi:hypothetical protein